MVHVLFLSNRFLSSKRLSDKRELKDLNQQTDNNTWVNSFAPTSAAAHTTERAVSTRTVPDPADTTASPPPVNLPRPISAPLAETSLASEPKIHRKSSLKSARSVAATDRPSLSFDLNVPEVTYDRDEDQEVRSRPPYALLPPNASVSP